MKSGSKTVRSISEGGNAAAERHVTIPLMVRSHDNIQFVEEDTDTVSENEPSTGIGRASNNGVEGNIYTEIQPPRRKMGFLEIPRFLIRTHSRTNSPETSSTQVSPTMERKSSWRKRSNHDYEKVSVTSNTSKKSTVERIAEGSFFRRRVDTSSESRRGGEDDEHILEALRQVVRKCTNVDPVKRPCSTDVLNILSTDKP